MRPSGSEFVVSKASLSLIYAPQLLVLFLKLVIVLTIPESLKVENYFKLF